MYCRKFICKDNLHTNMLLYGIQAMHAVRCLYVYLQAIRIRLFTLTYAHMHISQAEQKTKGGMRSSVYLYAYSEVSRWSHSGIQRFLKLGLQHLERFFSFAAFAWIWKITGLLQSLWVKEKALPFKANWCPHWRTWWGSRKAVLQAGVWTAQNIHLTYDKNRSQRQKCILITEKQS